MEKEELHKIKEMLFTTMKETFKKDGEVLPLAVIVKQDGQLDYIPMRFSNQLEKQIMTQQIKMMCQQLNPLAVAIMQEAWMAKVDKKDADALRKEMAEKGIGVKDLENKKEVTILLFETSAGNEMISCDIERKDNTLVNEVRTNEVKGIFSNLLSR